MYLATPTEDLGIDSILVLNSVTKSVWISRQAFSQNASHNIYSLSWILKLTLEVDHYLFSCSPFSCFLWWKDLTCSRTIKLRGQNSPTAKLRRLKINPKEIQNLAFEKKIKGKELRLKEKQLSRTLVDYNTMVIHKCST